MVNQVGLAALPKDFPQFVHEPEAAERVAFLAGEPDRWRNVPDLPIKQYNSVDHYLDVEQLAQAGIEVATVSSFRYDFVTQFAAGRAAHPENFRAIDPAKNTDHTREWPGFVLWTVTEYYGKLKSGFSYWKALQEAGRPDEIANAEKNIIELMGLMGHYVGDIAQPLHTTIHHNGWVGDNPNGYTTAPGIHSWIDGGFIAKAHVRLDELLPKVTEATPLSLEPRADGRDPVFVQVVDYFMAQHAQMVPLYELDKAGKFRIDHAPATPEGRAFIDKQLVIGGEMLARLWLTAWRAAPPDTYLRAQLLKRSAAKAESGKH